MDNQINENKYTEGHYSLEELWTESNGELSSQTFRELVRLGKKIENADGKKRRRNNFFTGCAVAASLAVVCLATFSLTRDKFSISPLESTRSLVAEYGQTSSLTLEDGTTVALNSGSSLLYPEAFNKGSRIVYITGEGNFSVAKDASRPFIVKTSHMDVQALGTSFCIHSYAGERTIRTTLKEGRVKVSIPEVGEGSYILEPGMQLIYTPSEKTVSFAKVDAGKVMEWEQGYMTFTNATFPEIASVLERRFDISVSYNAENMRKNALNVRFMPDETLKDALDILTLLMPGSRYKIDGNRVYFHF